MFNTPSRSDRSPSSGSSGRANNVPSSARLKRSLTLAFIACSDGMSNSRCGNTRPGGGAGLPVPGAGTPKAGSRSASTKRLPFSSPLSIGTLDLRSKLNRPPRRLSPTFNSALSSDHCSPDFAMRPFSTNGSVVGSVMPSESPTFASDGPDKTIAPSSAFTSRTSVPVPSKLKRDLPALTRIVIGTADAAAGGTSSGNTPREAM